METAEIPKLDLAASHDGFRSEEKLEAKNVSASDNVNNGFHYTAKADSFAIDMESYSNGTSKEIHSNSRITLQRNFSRKGSQRGGEKKNSASDGDLSSPRGCAVGSNMPEKPSVPVVGVGSPLDHSCGPQFHHQITITTNNSNSIGSERCTMRKNSFRRSSPSWLFDPKRILFFFATVSSMGTILLIYFTLSIGKFNSGVNGAD